MIFRRIHRGSPYHLLSRFPSLRLSFLTRATFRRIQSGLLCGSSSPPPPLREMVPLPTYQEPVTPDFNADVALAQATNEPEIVFDADAAALQAVREHEADVNDMPLVPVSRQEPSPPQELNNSIVLTFNAQTTLVSCPVSSPRNMMNDISENPSWSPLSCPAHISHLPITVTLNVRSTLVSPQ